jgi:hypothetical protein
MAPISGSASSARASAAARPSSQSQPSWTGSPSASIIQQPSPCPVTPSAATRGASPGLASTSARSTAAASAHVRRMSCSTPPLGSVV